MNISLTSKPLKHTKRQKGKKKKKNTQSPTIYEQKGCNEIPKETPK